MRLERGSSPCGSNPLSRTKKFGTLTEPNPLAGRVFRAAGHWLDGSTREPSIHSGFTWNVVTGVTGDNWHPQTLIARICRVRDLTSDTGDSDDNDSAAVVSFVTACLHVTAFGPVTFKFFFCCAMQKSLPPSSDRTGAFLV